MAEYHSISDLVKLSINNKQELWQVVLTGQAHDKLMSERDVFAQMKKMYQAMKSADEQYDQQLRSPSKMAGGDGYKMRIYNESGRNICGDFIGDGEKMRQYNATGKNLCSEYSSLAMEKALKMGESNACMKRIVAAPTAGSCGVIPAVLLSYEKYFGVTEDECVKALLIAAGIGAVIAENASIAGAAGGCQAEIGSASAMAAAGLAYMQGADSEGCANALALALKSMLGLTCDPVCGLVEVPCIKRNVSGAVNAITAAQMTMAGIKSVIPADEVIDSMRRIGNDMPVCLKETGEGGLAITPTAKVYKQKLNNIDN